MCATTHNSDLGFFSFFLSFFFLFLTVLEFELGGLMIARKELYHLSHALTPSDLDFY
jgi:hypothetical protein